MRKLILIIIMSMFLLNLVSAVSVLDEDVKQGDCISLYQYCPSCSYVNFTTMKYPNGTLEIFNYAMNQNGFNYNYTWCGTDVLGDYFYTTCGDKGGTNECEDISFKVTFTGKPLDVGMVVINIFLILLVIFSLVFASIRYRKIDFEKKSNQIVESHEGNFGKTILKGLGYGLMKNAFLWYYLAGWILLFLINELISLLDRKSVV